MKEQKYSRRKHLIFDVTKDNAIFVGESINQAKKESRKLQSTLGDGTLRLQKAS